MSENNGVCGHIRSVFAEGVAKMRIICAVYPIFFAGTYSAELFAGNVAAVIGIGRSVVANAAVNIGKTGNIEPADDIVIILNCGIYFIGANGKFNLWRIVGIFAGAVAGSNDDGVMGTFAFAAALVFIASGETDHNKNHKHRDNGEKNMLF